MPASTILATIALNVVVWLITRRTERRAANFVFAIGLALTVVAACFAGPPLSVHYAITTSTDRVGQPRRAHHPVLQAAIDRLEAEVDAQPAAILYSQHVGRPRYYKDAQQQWVIDPAGGTSGLPPEPDTQPWHDYLARVRAAFTWATEGLPEGSLCILDFEEYPPCWDIMTDERLKPYKAELLVKLQPMLLVPGMTEEKAEAIVREEWRTLVERLDAQTYLTCKALRPDMLIGFYNSPNHDKHLPLIDAGLIGGWQGVAFFPYGYVEYPLFTGHESRTPPGKWHDGRYVLNLAGAVAATPPESAGAFLMLARYHTRIEGENSALKRSEVRLSVGAALETNCAGVVYWSETVVNHPTVSEEAQADATAAYFTSLEAAVKEANADAMRKAVNKAAGRTR